MKNLKQYSVSVLKKEYKGAKDIKVRDRIQILILLRNSMTQREVSKEMEISVGKVPFWKIRFETKGFSGLVDKKGRGRKSSLNKKELKKLLIKIDNGICMSDGYIRGYKTKDVNEVLKKEFGITFTNRHCRRLLNSLGYVLKVPRPRNKRRNQESVDEFKQEFKKKFPVWIRKQ